MLIFVVDNTSYVNINIIEDNPGLESLAAAEYYAKKTGMLFSLPFMRYLTFLQVHGRQEQSILWHFLPYLQPL